MSLADRLKDGAAVHLPSCPFCRLLHSLSKDDAEALSAAAADPHWTTVAIVHAVRSEGHKISEKAVSYHRKGLCLP